MIIEKKIGALIPIRLASERLPKKAIKEICGKPVVYHLLDRVFDSNYLSKENVIVCTTKEMSDNCLVEIVKNYGAQIFRGSTNDIIKRFYDAMVKYGFDYVIQIDGDDITAEPIYMDLTMKELLSDDSLDVVSVEGLPLGIATKSFSMKAMEKVYQKYKTINNDTGFASYFTNTDFCNCKVIGPIYDDHKYDNVRLTLDYEDDFEFFRAIFNELYKEGEIFHLYDILNLIKRKPELTKINIFLNKKYMHRWNQKSKLMYSDKFGNIQKVKA